MRADRELIKDVAISPVGPGQGDSLQQLRLSEQLFVPDRIPSAPLTPLIQMVQLDSQDRRLQRIQPAIHSHQFMHIADSAAMDTEDGHRITQSTLVCRDQTAIAEPTEVLGRKETETAEIPERSRLHSISGRPDRLTGIFDHPDSTALGNFTNRFHLGTLPVQVDGNDRFGASGHLPLDLARIHVEGLWANVHEDRLGAQPGDGSDCRKKREGHRDHFIARPHAQRHQ